MRRRPLPPPPRRQRRRAATRGTRAQRPPPPRPTPGGACPRAAAFERVAIAVIERLPADDADARYAALLPEATHASLADRAGPLKLALAQHFVEFVAAPAVQQVAVALWRAPVKGGATTDEDTASAAAGALAVS